MSQVDWITEPVFGPWRSDHRMKVSEHARAIGQTMFEGFGGVPIEGAGGYSIPADSAEEIAHEITMVVAEIIQVWLDAGSERDVTIEDLGPAIEAHVASWVGGIEGGA